MAARAIQFDGLFCSAQLGSQNRITHRPQQLYFRWLPFPALGRWLEWGDLEGDSLLPDLMFGSPQAACQFVIIHRPEELYFPHRPRSRPCFHRDAIMLTHRDDFFDGAPTAASKDGIWRMAEPFKFGESPRRASAALGSDCSHVCHELFPLFISTRCMVPARMPTICRRFYARDQTRRD